MQDYLKCAAGKIVYVSPMWRDDSERARYGRLCKKGYFKRVTHRERRKGYPFGDYFERTDKQYVPNDSFSKPIDFSRTTPSPNHLPH